MSPRLSRRRTAIAVASAAAVLGAALFTGTATAATSAEPVSTPVPIVTPDGMLMSYILNTAKVANPGQAQVLVQRRPEGRRRRRPGLAARSASSWPTRTAPPSAPTSPQPPATRSSRSAPPARVRCPRAPPTASAPTWGTRRLRLQEGRQEGLQRRRARSADARRGRRPARGRAVGHADDQGRPGPHRSPTARATSSSACSTAASTPTTPTSPPTSTSRTRSTAPTPAGRTPRRPGWEPTTSDHGTHVAGTIAAARNGVGIVGVAPNVRIASVKVVNDDGFIYPEYAVCGFVWAGLKHMDVTNNSYYVDPFEFYCEDQPDQYAAKEAVRRAVDLVDEPGRRPRGRGRQLGATTCRTRRYRRHRQPGRRHRRHPDRSTAAATTSRPSSTASSPCRRCSASRPAR